MITSDPLPGPGETLSIEASAGTGKTWTISTLAARFIAERNISIQQMAIVTFSSASAAEVKARTFLRLKQCADALALPTPPSGTDEGLARLWSADPSIRDLRRDRLLQGLDDFDLAPIMTTHGFCDRLLTCLGILADHDSYDRLATDLTDLIREAASDRYLRLRQQGEVRFSYDQGLAWVQKAIFAPAAPVVPQGTEEALFVESVRADVEARKRRSGMYTFDDMLVRCRDSLMNLATSDGARARLSHSYPVVLVDEFQDTDAMQWEIIYRGFVGSSTVVLIGDPKQSIYGFRGADVGAYLKATDLGNTATLDTNYRSSPSVVDAVGSLMNGAELGDPRIRVTPVKTSADTPRLVADEPMEWEKSFRIRVPADTHPLSTEQARQLIDADLVADLTALLSHGPRYQTGPGTPPRKLRPEDIAIIVSTNGRGNGLLDQLHTAGIPAVFTGTGSVFSTPAAHDWWTFLKALDTGSPAWIRAASLTSLIGWDVERLVNADAEEFSRLASDMRRLSTLMERFAPMGVLEWLMDRTDIVSRLTADLDGQRIWTDLRHLGQLLSGPRPPLVSPADWLLARRSSATAPDESTRRLPTHNDAVRIMTVHQAKGLQFPIVYLPQLADRHVITPQIGEPTISRDASGERIVDLGTSPDNYWREAASEEAGESLRTCYVALTRSIAHITTWWVPTRDHTHTSPLHRLLFRTSPDPAPYVSLGGCDPHRLTLPGVSIETIGAAQPLLASEYVCHKEEVRGSHPRQDDTGMPGAVTTLHPVTPPAENPPFTREIDVTWRRTSFSALTAAAHQEAPEADEPTSPIEVHVGAEQDLELDRLSPMADLPGGTTFGSLVHSVFEYADPASDLTPLVEKTMAGFEGFTPQTLAAALAPGLVTPLGPIADNLSLADIGMENRLAEMHFELPLSHTDHAAAADSIADVLERHIPEGDPLSGYAEHLRSSEVDPRALRGYLSGSIDVVARIGGRYLIIDYKTNRLGAHDVPLTLRNYTFPAMETAMISSHYPLQALLYAVALHRFLRWRIPDYDPKRHLGGIAYLFVRGMAGPDTPVRYGTPCGVFPWNPPAALIEDLSDLLSGVPR